MGKPKKDTPDALPDGWVLTGKNSAERKVYDSIIEVTLHPNDRIVVDVDDNYGGGSGEGSGSYTSTDVPLAVLRRIGV